MKNWTILKIIALSLLSISLLTSCSKFNKQGYAAGNNQPLLSAHEYLQLASVSRGTSKQRYLLQAANRFVRNRQINSAQWVLNKISNKNLNNTLLTQKQLIQARLYLFRHQTNKALIKLQIITNNQKTLPAEQQIELHELLAAAYHKNGDIIDSIKQRQMLIPYLQSKPTKHENLLAIWQSLQSLSPQQVVTLKQQTQSPMIRGWLNLASATDQPDTSAQQLAKRIIQWRKAYPRHPANELLPKKITANRVFAAERPKHIALLLPLSGALSKQAKAIRDGFFAAYYYAKKRQKKTPEITVIDTSQGTIQAQYHRAVHEGADFVVGPLTKTNVTALANSTQLTVPTLALNTANDTSSTPIPNLYQFGLSPLDEAQQAAIKGWNDHHTRAVIIAPANAWGQNIANTFSRQWQAMGGRIIATMKYTDQRKLAYDVSKLLNINQSEQRKRDLRYILREKMRFVARRRKDIDMVFLVASPVIARQIRPLLKFYYAGHIPVYATSQVYRGIPDPHKDRDLDGILFTDMPWVLTPNHLKPSMLDALQQKVRSIWPSSYRNHPKLFALGVDAYDIIAKLNTMAMLPQLGTHAATGTLFLNQRHHLFRKLTWSQMIQGTPHPVQ